MISANLIQLRKFHGFSQEYVAEQIGVSRQAVAKWEAGETTPDLSNSAALARLYNVTLDDLVNFDAAKSGYGIPPKGCHIFGMVKVGDRGQIVIPKDAREIFHISCGDQLIILGDEAQGLAMMKADDFLAFFHQATRKGEDQ